MLCVRECVYSAVYMCAAGVERELYNLYSFSYLELERVYFHLPQSHTSLSIYILYYRLLIIIIIR